MVMIPLLPRMLALLFWSFRSHTFAFSPSSYMPKAWLPFILCGRLGQELYGAPPTVLDTDAASQEDMALSRREIQAKERASRKRGDHSQAQAVADLTDVIGESVRAQRVEAETIRVLKEKKNLLLQREVELQQLRIRIDTLREALPYLPEEEKSAAASEMVALSREVQSWSPINLTTVTAASVTSASVGASERSSGAAEQLVLPVVFSTPAQMLPPRSPPSPPLPPSLPSPPLPSSSNSAAANVVPNNCADDGSGLDAGKPTRRKRVQVLEDSYKEAKDKHLSMKNEIALLTRKKEMKKRLTKKEQDKLERHTRKLPVFEHKMTEAHRKLMKFTEERDGQDDVEDEMTAPASASSGDSTAAVSPGVEEHPSRPEQVEEYSM